MVFVGGWVGIEELDKLDSGKVGVGEGGGPQGECSKPWSLWGSGAVGQGTYHFVWIGLALCRWFPGVHLKYVVLLSSHTSWSHL